MLEVIGWMFVAFIWYMLSNIVVIKVDDGRFESIIKGMPFRALAIFLWPITVPIYYILIKRGG